MNVYPFIEAENASITGNVKRACELLQVSRSAYYTHRTRQTGQPAGRALEDTTLTARITRIHGESRGTYGAPRVHAELRAQGARHGRKRIARLMRAAGLTGRAPKRWRTTTVPDPTATPREDLIGRDFTPTSTGINQRWCGTSPTSRPGKAGSTSPP